MSTDVIRRNSRLIPALKTRLTDCLRYDAGNSYQGRACDPEHAWARLAESPRASLTVAGGVYTIRVHDALWYELREGAPEPTAASVDAVITAAGMDPRLAPADMRRVIGEALRRGWHRGRDDALADVLLADAPAQVDAVLDVLAPMSTGLAAVGFGEVRLPVIRLDAGGVMTEPSDEQLTALARQIVTAIRTASGPAS